MTSPLRNVRNYNPDRNIDKAFADKDFDHGKFLSARELRAALQELDIIVTREEAEVYLKDYDLERLQHYVIRKDVHTCVLESPDASERSSSRTKPQGQRAAAGRRGARHGPANPTATRT